MRIHAFLQNLGKTAVLGFSGGLEGESYGRTHTHTTRNGFGAEGKGSKWKQVFL